MSFDHVGLEGENELKHQNYRAGQEVLGRGGWGGVCAEDRLTGLILQILHTGGMATNCNMIGD